VIGVRLGVAFALVVAVAGLALGGAALVGTIRDDGSPSGRLVQTRITNRLNGDPVLFSLDDFYMSPDGEGRVHALYLYPPGYFGHNRGCKIVWQADATALDGARRIGPGLFTDPCSGAHFDRTGALINGSADRALDYFAMTPEPDGFLVDTQKLLCGDNLPNEAAGMTPTPTPETPARCDRAAPGATAR
jgi:hypothetical protein